ncbi:MAG: ZIP family zinc transporter [Actinomycetota bacterium]|nr:ZIP family zinc transporter [Actinomycetota bacterium]
MLEAALWGLVGGGSLVVGAALGLRLSPSQRAIGLVMAFGAGVLVSAAAFELTDEAFRRGGRDAALIGLAAGGLAFFAADWLVDRFGGEHRKRSGSQQQGGAAGALVIGSLLDGIPESAAIGISLLEGEGVGIAVVAAVFISNVPESLSAAVGLRTAGRSPGWIMGLWAAVAGASALAALAGFVLLDGASGDLIGGIQAFAAGAIVVMLADTMIPEAYEDSGRWVGLVTVAGFGLAFLLSTLE